MRLSDRLAAIAAYIHLGETVADIGTDHGLLPIFLLLKGISPKVIMSDVKIGPLKKAEVNIAKYAPDMNPDLRLGSGLEPIGFGEADAVVIAGMGGATISDIMGADPEKTRSFKKFILQPRNCRDKLRMWLYNNGYTIVNERLVREGDYICELIKVDNTIIPDMYERRLLFKQKLSDMEFEISPLLFSNNDPLLKELIACRIETEEEIIGSIREKGSSASRDQLNEKLERVIKLRALYKRT